MLAYIAASMAGRTAKIVQMARTGQEDDESMLQASVFMGKLIRDL
jgi:hypothetical protein